ncbi:MAG: peptidase U32 family protein [Erysipelotrichaceae bacterium]
MEKIELLAPAGDLERLKIAVMYGADAVFIGGKQFSLRARASNFDVEDIAEGVRFANQYGAKIHVTLNMLPHEHDLEGLQTYVEQLEAAGVTALICASPSIAMTAKKYTKNVEIHVSTQHSSTNSSVVKFWQDQGMDRVVLGRECTMEEIEATAKASSLPLEVFLHGGMCISYSGRCTLSNNMTNRDANRGGCAQSCRWKYRMYAGDKQINEGLEMFSMSSKDMAAARYIPRIIEAGCASLKIEGRMKSSYYIATVVKTYRMLIDEYYEKGLSEERIQFYEKELEKCENRPTNVGFYGGLPSHLGQLFGVNGAGVTQEFIAYVLDYDDATQMATLEVRNNFKEQETIEVFGPHIYNERTVLSTLYDMDGNVLETANKPMMKIKTKLSFAVEKHDMIRRVMVKNRKDVY